MLNGSAEEQDGACAEKAGRRAAFRDIELKSAWHGSHIRAPRSPQIAHDSMPRETMRGESGIPPDLRDTSLTGRCVQPDGRRPRTPLPAYQRLGSSRSRRPTRPDADAVLPDSDISVSPERNHKSSCTMDLSDLLGVTRGKPRRGRRRLPPKTLNVPGARADALVRAGLEPRRRDRDTCA